MFFYKNRHFLLFPFFSIYFYNDKDFYFVFKFPGIYSSEDFLFYYIIGFVVSSLERSSMLILLQRVFQNNLHFFEVHRELYSLGLFICKHLSRVFSSVISLKRISCYYLLLVLNNIHVLAALNFIVFSFYLYLIDY